MATPSSPSKMVSSTNLSLSNTSPWRLKVTVEAEPDNDLFLDLAQEESLTRKTRKPKASRSKPVSKNIIQPSKEDNESTISEDSLGLDNISGIFAAPDIATPKRSPPKRPKTPKAIIVPLKGSEQKQKAPKRKGTPARKRVKAVDLSALEPEPTITPKRGRGRPRKSISNAVVTPMPTNNTSLGANTRRVELDEGENMGVDNSRPPTPVEDTFHMPSPPSSPSPEAAGQDKQSLEHRSQDQDDPSIIASEGFSMIAPRHATLMQGTIGLGTPRPTPDLEEPPAKDPISASRALTGAVSETVDPFTSSKQTSQQTANQKSAGENSSGPLNSGPRRRRSLRLASQPLEEYTRPDNSATTSKVMGPLHHTTRNISTKENESPLAGPKGDASSFRRFLRAEPVNIIPGQYEESTVYFAQNKPAKASKKRQQTPAKISRSLIIESEENNFEQIIPDYLLPPANPSIHQQKKTTKARPKANVQQPAPIIRKEIPNIQARTLSTRVETPDIFDEEGRSVRWHEDVHGGSFSHSSFSIERPEPVAPEQESTHRLLENEIFAEPFRPNAGKLKDGSQMPLVVPREWTNHYWAVLTKLAYPETNLAARNQRTMASLHPEESVEEAMDRRHRILARFPRNEKGQLILSENDSDVVDAFEEHMRREIIGQKRIAGETRRMWGFSRHQIKEALIVLQVSRQRRIQWVLSAGEDLEDWGLA